MTKHASLSDFFDNYPDVGRRAAPLGVNEQELSSWAEQSIPTKNKPGVGRLGTLAFWTVIAGLLIARFFLIDPEKLRPVETSPAPAISQTTNAR